MVMSKHEILDDCFPVLGKERSDVFDVRRHRASISRIRFTYLQRRIV